MAQDSKNNKGSYVASSVCSSLAVVVCLLLWAYLPEKYGYDAVEESPTMRPYPDDPSCWVAQFGNHKDIFCQTTMAHPRVSWATLPSVWPSYPGIIQESESYNWTVALLDGTQLVPARDCLDFVNCTTWNHKDATVAEEFSLRECPEDLCMQRNQVPLFVLAVYGIVSASCLCLTFVCICAMGFAAAVSQK